MFILKSQMQLVCTEFYSLITKQMLSSSSIRSYTVDKWLHYWVFGKFGLVEYFMNINQ